jgi:CHAD domain
VKARKVRGLDADGALAVEAVRIARTRIAELWSLADAARDPDDVKALHDMRIAAKRVRYLLELMEPCLGPAAKRGAKRAKALQSLLGEVHDCDEMLPLVRGHVKRLRAEDAAAVRATVGDADDLDPGAARAIPNRTRYRGLESLHAYLVARRSVLYGRFLREWAKLEARGFRDRLERELAAAAEAATDAAAA